MAVLSDTATSGESGQGHAVRPTCRWCGEKFTTRVGEGRSRGCPTCEPPLLTREETLRKPGAGLTTHATADATNASGADA